MSGWKLILLDLIISIVCSSGVYVLFLIAIENLYFRIGVPVIMGICLFFVLTAIQSGSTPEG